jgi:UDP-glucose 4-epimerase
MKENILVTGGAGFIGTHLNRELLKLNHKVISLDLKEPKNRVLGVHYFRGDARDQKTVSTLVSEHEITLIYHLAATVSVPLCQSNPVESYSHNVLATQTVLEVAKLSKKPIRVGFASSAALYGNLGDSRVPLEEDKIASRFSSFYAAQKHASEKMIELYTHYFNIPTLIFRFFNVYGHGQDPDSPYSGVITIFNRLASQNKPIFVHNSGVQSRDFISVSDIAHTLANSSALPQTKWDASVVNLGSGSSITIKELAYLIRKIVGSNAPIIDAPPREGDVLHSLANIERAKRILNFNPCTEFHKKLKSVLTG